MNRERDPNHCSLRLFEKNNKPKHFPTAEVEGKKEGKKAQYKTSNVKLKVTGLQIIPLKLKPALQVPQAWTWKGAPVASLNQQVWQGGIVHSSNISHPFRKSSVSKNGITSSVPVSRFLVLHLGNLEVQKKEPKQCSKHCRQQLRSQQS